ncbi:MAG: tetratricopeptide repeat protein [Sandaracinaceae bacterium]|nr:tetratricopeptide repeat protein [Sandaracinaceae bacterium]
MRIRVASLPVSWVPPLSRVAFTLLCAGCAGGLPPVAVAAQRHNDAGTELLAGNHLDDAEARFRLALEYHPHFAEAHLNLGLVLLARGRQGEAGEHLRTAVELDEDYAEAHGNLGVYYLLVGDSVRAERSFERPRHRPGPARAPAEPGGAVDHPRALPRSPRAAAAPGAGGPRRPAGARLAGLLRPAPGAAGRGAGPRGQGAHA